MRDKELRLALICYGGISLAVYMHGITKEAWRLAKASQAFNDGTPPVEGSQAVYSALLAEIADAAQTRLHVIVDIITGASAGGINGVFLAQALATGQSLEPLTQLWLDKADVEVLLDPNGRPSSRFAKIWAVPIAWMAAGRNGDALADADETTRDEINAKLGAFVRSRWFTPPFGGPRFTNLLLDALDTMAASTPGPRLLPAGQPLDLFVTVTDFRGHPERLTLNSPAEVMETEHRLTLTFNDPGDGSFADPAELAFAARATASFPGAFPPFTVAELDTVLAERAREWPGRAAYLKRALPRHAAVNAADTAVLIDGSVLANAPFRPAIDALKERPARREVDRRFVYIDPKPNMRSISFAARDDAVPGFFTTILGAMTDIPREQPIRDNLEAIEARSARIRRMRHVLETLRPSVDAQVTALFGSTLFLDRPTPRRVEIWRSRAQTAAARGAGYGYVAYGQLKMTGIVDDIVALFHRIGGDTSALRFEAIQRSVWQTITTRGLDTVTVDDGDSASPEAIDFFRDHDLRFRIRRLRFVARSLNDLTQDDAADPAVTAMRDAIYSALALYLDRVTTEFHRGLESALSSADFEAGPVIDALAQARELVSADRETDARIAQALVALPRDLRRPLLLAYLGFAYYDIATLPLLQGEGLDEFDPVKVDRISPDDAASIRSGGAEATLKGIQFNSFGAFFSRAYRENDYLWGRLHGAERLIDILVSAMPAGVRLKAGQLAAFKRRAFLAILDEEEPKLTAVSPLFAELRAEIG